MFQLLYGVCVSIYVEADNSDIIIIIYCIPLLQPSSPVVWCNGTESTSSVHLKNSKTQNNVLYVLTYRYFCLVSGRGGSVET